jgi:hypothetical protein
MKGATARKLNACLKRKAAPLTRPSTNRTGACCSVRRVRQRFTQRRPWACNGSGGACFAQAALSAVSLGAVCAAATTGWRTR